jgi:CRISPR/Cas system endoribonuclease Cas6 (RAMP superfamily)
MSKVSLTVQHFKQCALQLVQNGSKAIATLYKVAMYLHTNNKTKMGFQVFQASPKH